MTTKQPETPQELRRRAEEKFSADETDSLQTPTPEEAKILLHDLRVHQIELEMQVEELRMKQSELDTARARYFELYDLAPMGYLTLNAQGLIYEANLAAATMLDVTRKVLLHKTMSQITSHEDQDVYYIHRKRLDDTGEAQVWEMRLMRVDGSVFWAHLQAIPAQNGEYWIVFNDISERRKIEEEKLLLEQQFQQARKMEAIGQLAGGVAHDFNNKLMVIMGNVTLARMDIDDSAKVLNHLAEIQLATEHSRDITFRLLAFSRQQVICPQTLNANNVVVEVLKSLYRLIGEHISIKFVPGDNLWSVRIDPVQLDQIVMNMAVNARDAMPDGGTFTITTENLTMDSSNSSSNIASVPGDFVRITFSDNGFGMDQETLTHIFEPFFTTKDIGKGTGLGLATIHGIISQNNGFIDVESTPGSGTAFKVYLPRHESPSSDIIKSDVAICSGSGSILLVEDEEAVREITALFLRKIGYTVYEAESPGMALELAVDLSIKLDLVLTDFLMPEMNGKVLMERILVIRPEIKYIYASGYTANHVALGDAVISGGSFIQKPFDLKMLSKHLMRLINSGQET